jgi:acetolactate synthase-1/2/3 large subunit
VRVVDAIAEWFEVAGFHKYFGYAGGSIWPFLDALTPKTNTLEGIQAKHEAHAVHMADMYYRLTGKIAPVIINKGPGLLNAVGAAASAMHDSAPVLIIAGSGTTHFMGKAGMQEIFYHGHEDALNVFRPVVKGCWLIIRPDSAIDILNTAVKVATSGRPGPVFVQLPYDIQLAEVEGEIEPPLRRGPTLGRMRADQDSVRRVADMIAQAQRPLLLAGGGVIRAQAADALRAAVEKLQIPVATTLPAKGQISEDHPLSLGTLGRSGWASAAEASREADLIVGVGARFSDNHTANWRKGSIYDVSQTKIVQVDVDGTEIGRNFPVELGLVSDARLFLEDLAAASKGPNPAHQDWIKRSRGYRTAWLKEIEPLQQAKTAPVHPARLVYEVGEALGPNGVAYIDIGDVTQYAEAYMFVRRPGAWQISPGMAEMGWAASGVVGGVAADPSRPAVVLTGDGAFNLVNQAVCTAVEYNLPAVWVILNNYEFGIERKGMERSYQRSHPWCTFTRKDTGERYNPDYVKLAHAYGAEGARIEDPELLGPTLRKAIASRRPWIIDVPIDLTVGSYFTKGIDRAYPSEWAKTYPSYGGLRSVDKK